MKAVWTIVLALAFALAGCGSETTSDVADRIDEKVFALTPSEAAVEIGVLRGRLTDLQVVERVNAETGDVVSAPQLTGTLTLENASEDRAVRVVAGRVEYLDQSGARIALAKDRGDADIQIYGYSGDRLDPGGTTSHRIDVPFPSAALGEADLAEVRLDLTYIPMPYREESAAVAVVLTPQS